MQYQLMSHFNFRLLKVFFLRLICTAFDFLYFDLTDPLSNLCNFLLLDFRLMTISLDVRL